MSSNIVVWERGISYLKFLPFLLISSTCLHVALFKCYQSETKFYLKKYDKDLLPVSGTLASDIVSISNILSLAMINVTLNENRICLKPVLQRWLAGPTIEIIEWDKVDLEKHELSGYYKVPYTGRYFLEIIALLCNDFQFHQDFSATCLEELIKNRTCLKPVLRGRLAGPTIAIIEWDKVDLGKHELSGY